MQSMSAADGAGFIPLEGIARKAEIAIYCNLASMSVFVPILMWITATEGAQLKADDPVTLMQGLGSLVGIILYLASLITAAVFFCKWMYRAHMDALHFETGQAPTEQDAKTARVNIVASWYIPIINLFKPYQNMTQLWFASDAKGMTKPEARAAKVPVEIRVWWACWIGALILDRIGGGKVITVEINEAALAGYTVLRVVAGILLIKIMKTITERMEHRIHMVTAQR
jgi:hypothetical protein